jgi:hypothetical protein
MVKSINVNKMWKLFGGCIYNLEVPCWCILYAGTMCLRICWYELKTEKMHGMYIKILMLQKRTFSNIIIRTVH